MLNSLTLGNQQFPSLLIQGPLAGISCAPFRRLIWRYSRPAFTCTEMISCKTILHAPLKLQHRFIQRDPQEGPVCFQLSGQNPQELAETVKRVTDLGADLIDLNCGCPVRKIRKKGEGSSLLTDTPTLYKLIQAMKNNTHLPVSIKIRVEGGGEKFNQEVATVIQDAGADFVIVHGRHWTQHYETPCRHDAIKFFVENLNVPVIGNGDIADMDSLKTMFATGCAGVMIARAGVGQPWLIAKLTAAMRNESYIMPTPLEIADVFLEHVQGLVELLNSEKFAILQARQFAKYYARNIPKRTEFAEAVNQCSEFKELTELCRKYFTEDQQNTA